jgi:hypothetical protein
VTKLDAVNIMLRARGMAGAAALDTDGGSDAAQAERVLDSVELEIQSRGWAYNTRTEVTLSPDDADHIALPSGTITIDSDGSDAGRNVSQLGGRLYDLDNNTDEFDGDLIVTYILRYDFGCIPQPVQQYIAAKAAMEYANRYPTRVDRTPMLASQYREARAEAFRFDDETSDVNVLDAVDAQRVRGRRTRLTGF